MPSIANDTGVEWVEVDGVIYDQDTLVGAEGGTGLNRGTCAWTATSATAPATLIPLDFSSRSAWTTGPNAAGRNWWWSPAAGRRCGVIWSNVLKADDADNGDWLVSGVGFDGYRAARPSTC